MINENLTNEEEADFNDKYTRILVKYPKENNIKTSNLNSNAGLDHSSETKHGNYAIEYCITSLGEYRIFTIKVPSSNNCLPTNKCPSL